MATDHIKNMLYSHRKYIEKEKSTISFFRNSCDICGKMNSLNSDRAVPETIHWLKIE